MVCTSTALTGSMARGIDMPSIDSSFGRASSCSSTASSVVVVVDAVVPGPRANLGELARLFLLEPT